MATTLQNTATHSAENLAKVVASGAAQDATPELAAFREETRAWLIQHCPAEMRRPMTSEDDACWGGRNVKFSCPAQQQWLQTMAARGWTVPAWPTAYGGGGLSGEQAKILAQEMRSLQCRSPLQSFGIWMLGPALLKFGSEAQKLEHLPRIARGEIRWCQGYSEPNAGSDLASLATRAEDLGDHFIVNGQKIWTSYADLADWIFCLVRTDSAKKHTGISFVLFDMASPGVSTRPILLISGKSPFCETFFDNVRVEKSNLVGHAGGGWDVAKYLLTHEREMIGGIGARRLCQGQTRVRFAQRALCSRSQPTPARDVQPKREGHSDAENQMQPGCDRARHFTAQVVKAITGERECDREAGERCTEQAIAIDRPGNTNVRRQQ